MMSLAVCVQHTKSAPAKSGLAWTGVDTLRPLFAKGEFCADHQSVFADYEELCRIGKQVDTELLRLLLRPLHERTNLFS